MQMKKRQIISIIFLLLLVIFFVFIIILIRNTNINNKSSNTYIVPISSPTLIPSPNPINTPTLTLTPTIEPKVTKVSLFSPQSSLDELFLKYGNYYGVDPGILKSIASCESGFDVNQITGDYAGLFQFGSIPWQEARARLGENADLSLRFNAEESIKTAAHEIQIKGTSGWDDCD